MFPCEQCGCCCRNIRGAQAYGELDQGDGTCRYLDMRTMRCTVYDTRPLLCRVDDYYDEYVSERMSRAEYYSINKAACQELRRKCRAMETTAIREHLAKHLYEINASRGFMLSTKLLSWSSPSVGFMHDKSRIIKTMDKLMSDVIKGRAQRTDVLGYLADWGDIAAEGIVFTVEAIFVKSPKNQDKEFMLRYADIASIDYREGEKPVLELKTKYGITKRINTPLFSKVAIEMFLREAVKLYEADNEKLVW